MTRIASMSEELLQKHIVKLLTAYARPDIEWHHVPNGEERHPATARKLKDMGVQSGVGDIMLLIDSRSHALELKTEIGTQSGAQSEWQERHERAGGIYHIAFGLDQALGILQGINAFRPGVTIHNALGKGARGEGISTRSSPQSFTSEPRAPA